MTHYTQSKTELESYLCFNESINHLASSDHGSTFDDIYAENKSTEEMYYDILFAEVDG